MVSARPMMARYFTVMGLKLFVSSFRGLIGAEKGFSVKENFVSESYLCRCSRCGGRLRSGCRGGFRGWGFSGFFRHLRLFGLLGVFGMFPEFGAEEVGFFIKREFFHGIDFFDLGGVFEGRLRGGEFKAFASELQSADFQVELEELGEGFEVSFFDGLIHEFDQAGIEPGFNDGQSGERGGCHRLKIVSKGAAGYRNKYGNCGNHGKKATGG